MKRFIVVFLIILIIVNACGCGATQPQVFNTALPTRSEAAHSSFSAKSPAPATAPPSSSPVCEKKVLSFSLRPEDNKGIESPLCWSVDGDTIYLAVTYAVPDSVLECAVPFIETSHGSELLAPMDLTSSQVLTVFDSNGLSFSYNIVTERITYNLPVFYIEIENDAEVTSREDYLRASLRVDVPAPSSAASATFPYLQEKEILIRGRGHYSWNFPKTPYKIRFHEKTSVLGLNASKNWVLLANYVDRSLLQNYVALEMGKVMDNIPYHSSQYPVDVFVNGSYRGVYTFGEQLEAKEERINLEDFSAEPDTDYLLELGGKDDGDVLGVDYFHAGTLKFAAIKHPDSSLLTESQRDFLISYVQQADKAVQNLDNYEEYIDVDSLIDWFIIHELSYNLDCCFRRSCFLIKEKGGKLKMGPIWDFDLAFGSYFRYEEGDWASEGFSGGYVGITWINFLLKDSAFTSRLRARWNEIKERLLDQALNAVDHMSALIAPSAEFNFKVWPILGQSIPSQPDSHKKYNTYSLQVSRLRKFILSRYEWMDDTISTMN